MALLILAAVTASGCGLRPKNRVVFSPIEKGRAIHAAKCTMHLGTEDPQTLKKSDHIVTWADYKDGGESQKVHSLAGNGKPYESCDRFFRYAAKTAKERPEGPEKNSGRE
jgi:hypothetical protein